MFKIKAIATLILAIACQQGFAQNTTSSPYSRYGLGDLNSTGFASHFSMGGLTAPIAHGNMLNISNPASYAYLKRPVFDFGVQSKTLQLSDATTTESSNSVALRNVAFGFPLSKRWGASFGLLPYSSTGYTISQTSFYSSIESDVETLYEGEGGVNQFFIGSGYQLLSKDSSSLSFGFNASYLFGSVDRYRRTIYPDNVGFFNSRVRNSMRVSDVVFDAGLQYNTYISENLRFGAGASFNISSDVNASQDMLSVTYESTAFGFEIVKDTVEMQDTITGSVFMPQRYGIGFAFEWKKQWLIGVEYNAQDWSNYKESFGDVEVTDQLGSSQQFILGVRYRPQMNLSPNAKLWSNINYRAGFRYGTSYLQLDNTQLTEYGVSFGLGIPLAKTWSTLNFGIEVGERGSTDNNLVREQVMNLYVGLSLSPLERWFYKRKYD